MRFNPKILVVLLATAGFIAYAVDRPKKTVVTTVRKSAIKILAARTSAQSPAQKPQKPKMPVTPSIEDFPELWSLKPLARPSVPMAVPMAVPTAVPTAPAGSVNPIDAFVQELYLEKKVTPVGPADQRTLLRRVYMDLIGI